MEFSEILEKIKKENSEKIVLIKCGIFYIGTGRDAIMLNNLFGLRPICYKEKICKCAIPVELLEKYLDDLNRTGYGYIVYDYYPGKERMEQEEIAKKEGKKIEIEEEHFDCSRCWYKRNRIEKWLRENKDVLENMGKKEDRI